MDETNVILSLDLDNAQAAFGLVRLSAGDVEFLGSLMFAEFHQRSTTHGLAMSDAEIREACWAPLVARLAGMAGTPLADRAPQEITFAHRDLCFLVMAAFRVTGPGERIVLELTSQGEASLHRRPHRLLGRNRHVFGSYRKAMAQPAAAFGQVG